MGLDNVPIATPLNRSESKIVYEYSLYNLHLCIKTEQKFGLHNSVRSYSWIARLKIVVCLMLKMNLDCIKFYMDLCCGRFCAKSLLMINGVQFFTKFKYTAKKNNFIFMVIFNLQRIILRFCTLFVCTTYPYNLPVIVSRVHFEGFPSL